MIPEYGRSVARCDASDLHQHMKAYREARKEAFDIKTAAEDKVKSLENRLQKLLKDNRHVTKTAQREKKAAEKSRRKSFLKKQLAYEEKAKAKGRLREERVRFWPRKVYQVVLTLHTNAVLTPSSSRRGSIESLVKPASQSPSGASPSASKSGSTSAQISSQISLSLSYSTHSASWSPRYDLNLSTPGRSGTITYHAEFCNQTSECWRDAKVILSTSQTTFQSLSEPIPTLLPWQIRLSKSAGFNHGDEALVSRNETASRSMVSNIAGKNHHESRDTLFGLNNNNPPRMPTLDDLNGPHPSHSRSTGPFFQMQQQHANQQANLQAMQARQLQSVQDQYSYQAQQQQQQQQQPPPPPQLQQLSQNVYSFQVPQMQGGHMPTHQEHSSRPTRSQPPGSQVSDLDAETITPDDPIMSFEESAWEETGLTATYDVPGLRTISPSNTTRRHKIASVTLHDVRLSYILIPKLREAAFLQARLRNSSSITLLRGPAGLTLDGSFLGNIILPRCSAGQPFSLNLGIDPAVRVVYQKPAVHHRQSGIFQKEGSGVYSRAVTVTNTKSNAAVEGVVLDQIPVSEDERLKVEICQPKGLKAEGDRVNCGMILEGTFGGGSGPGASRKTSSGAGTTATNTTKPTPIPTPIQVNDRQPSKSVAVASMRKGGEICWEFHLGMGKAMRLALEYETRYPSGEKVV